VKKGIVLAWLAALLALAAVPAQAADAAWTASYWNNMTLTGAPVVTRSESMLSHDWRTASPIPGTINADHFSARWTRSVSFTTDHYLFRASSDDGIRVWVDGNLIIDQWTDHPVQTAVVPLDMTAGDHALKVEYHENRGDAIAVLAWSTLSANPWKVSYFRGSGLTGTPVTRYENLLSYHWNASNPVPGINASNFSGRWSRTQTFAAGRVRFKVTANGGFRLYLDDDLILNEWYNHNGTPSIVKDTVDAGPHRIRLDYYSRSQPALLMLGIK